MSIKVESTTDSKEAVDKINGINSKSEADKKTSASNETDLDESNSDDSETSENDLESLESTDDDEQESMDDSKSDKPKKKGGFQKKINKLTAKLTALEQRALAAEAALLARQEPAVKDDKKTEIKKDGRPNPDDFDTNADYIDALTDWKLEQSKAKEKAENEKNQAKTEAQKRAEGFQSKINEFKKEHTDFDEVIEACEVDLSKDLQSMILESDLAPQIMYDLADKPEEIERLNKLKGLHLAKALGVLEDRLTKESESKKEKPKTSKAPTPITPVGSKGASKLTKHPDDMTYQEYKEYMASKKK